MAKNKKEKQKFSKSTPSVMTKLKIETKHTIWAILFFVLAVFLLMSMFSGAGKAGNFVYDFLNYFLGIGYVLLPLLFILLGSSFLKSETPNIGWTRAISGTLFLLSGLGMIDVVSQEHSGGFLGRILSTPLVALFDVYASIIFLGAILIISILVMFDAKPDLSPLLKSIWNFLTGKKSLDNARDDSVNKLTESEMKEVEKVSAPLLDEEGAGGGNSKKSPPRPSDTPPQQGGEEEEEDLPIKKRKGGLISTYVPPPLSLLEEDQGKPNTGDIKANANIIKRTLLNFGIEVEMDEITVGPTVTRYALKPAEGVKLSRIVGLQNDLALSLAAHPIRIEAPIPGKSLVGIEIPNKSKSIVGLATLLGDSKFQNSSKPLTIALGREISGKAIFGNLAKMPHCLVAGTTGSGKSVSIHAMITSLLYRNGPDDLKFILIDPKRVELTLYNNIPHLLTPVITEAKKTILALKWAAREMDRRYDILEAESVRDIESYHANVWKEGGKKTPSSSPLSGGENKETSPDKGRLEGLDRLPYIVIVIDELADIMSTYPRELESAIVRLAQMSRAVGIHLILSTQRPEVNIITGLIKANIPARVALKVSSQVDSRTILDAGGAEKLLGAGDMLYSSGDAQPERLQSAFISENEVKKVVKYLADAYKDEIGDEISLTTGSISADKSIFESTLDNDDDDDDEMYEEARLCVIEAGKASTSYLQRKLKLGYARAARLMDKLEERGVISAGDGAKPREVLEKINHDENGDNLVQ
ncbi:MAG: DNA translocase FtsK 4TM domain-containing protein [Candidatus Nomurabacteria bacterium]|nr:DNA translocase FtsK 4TM domain-containing protein [Candidatus Nomurabacteria bacterium]